MKKFSTLPLSKEMMDNLDKLGFSTMTPVQQEAIPHVLQKKDILVEAKTGSGKTAAFGIGLLQNLEVKRFRIQSLILCPTRELAEQVSKELRRLARFRHNIKLLTLTGGLPMYRQELSLQHLAHIVVGTPGRVLKLLERKSLLLDDLSMLVLDEADRMLDMGFIDQIHSIFKYAPVKRQTLCFSATFPKEVTILANAIMKKPLEIRIAENDKDFVAVEHNFYSIQGSSKTSALLSLLHEHMPKSAIIFCNTKERCRILEAELNRAGLHALALHGDLEQKERTEVLVRFSNKSSRILIASDVAARGLDIEKLEAVYNYDFPHDVETYIHRVGRTGRAGEAGKAFSFVGPKEEKLFVRIQDTYKDNFALKEIVAGDKPEESPFAKPEMITLSINGGRKNKISPGDILGALTASGELSGDDIGKIDRFDFITFFAVKRSVAMTALTILKHVLIKGKEFKVRLHE